MPKTLTDRAVLITGVSSGLGRSLAEALLTEGARVAGTVRHPAQVADFEALAPDGRARGIVMDITDPAAVAAGVAHAVEAFGRIDALVNNAGAGLVGAIEEASDDEARQVFETNFFGALAVTRAVLPGMRRRRSGHILFASAIGGFTGVPGLGLYTAAKGATDILGEALAGELAPLGIDVTVLTLGVFHTEFAGPRLPYSEPAIADYAATPAGRFRGFIGTLQGRQPNDAARGAQAILELLRADPPPVRAPIGGDAVEVMRGKLSQVAAEIDAWEANARRAVRDAAAV